MNFSLKQMNIEFTQSCTVINIRWFNKLNKYKTKKRNEKFVTCEYEASIQF